MLRSIRRDLNHPRAKTTVTVAMDHSAEGTRLGLDVLPAQMSADERRLVARVLADERGRVVFNPGVKAGSEGPIVRFDCHWVSWSPQVVEDTSVLPSIVLVDPAAKLPDGSIELGGGVVGH